MNEVKFNVNENPIISSIIEYTLEKDNADDVVDALVYSAPYLKMIL